MHYMLPYDKFELLTFTFVLKDWEHKFLGSLRQVYSVDFIACVLKDIMDNYSVLSRNWDI